LGCLKKKIREMCATDLWIGKGKKTTIHLSDRRGGELPGGTGWGVRGKALRKDLGKRGIKTKSSKGERVVHTSREHQKDFTWGGSPVEIREK